MTEFVHPTRADAVIWLPSGHRLNELATRYPGQLHVNPHGGVFGLTMNAVPPFDDLNVRRALAYAIDRERTVVILGGARHWRATCQLQPQARLPERTSYASFSKTTRSEQEDETSMRPHAGDTITVESEKVAQPSRTGVIEEVLKEDPPRLRVRWQDGHTSILTPSAGAARITRRKTGVKA